MFDFDYESDVQIHSEPRWGRIGTLSGTFFAMVGATLAVLTVPSVALVWAVRVIGG
ncbi:hypothetical protein Acy02nite_35400 [Actinoplanes cyaneus]|uniref:Uncharacterized protein n=1 Tax=Actinoplanes cyaneus TaxID=52696 RepID=A0A919M7Q2_9ACTN|nr:hypothetical protein [Actinoplanes cyaneus]MCW2140341.1 hypothetical protein [Actinoplanes cyaneus]GID65659.1 hypothetical protein Acy02nite_35400 [Actinoplanes cyaneus]